MDPDHHSPVDDRAPSHGGSRPGAGRHRRRIALDPMTARRLALLKKHRQRHVPEITEAQIVTELISVAWRAVADQDVDPQTSVD